MVSLDQHPTVLHHRAHAADRAPAPATHDAAWLRRFGSFLLFGTVLIDAEVSASTQPIAYLAKERGLLGAVLRRKIRLRDDPRLQLAFGRCFPS
jgi:hypothetical protein